jgi:zinc transport system ATP-binding protein
LLAPNPIVELRDVSVRYSNGVLALDRITLDVNDRDLIGLIGPNGAGKSTLLSVILGLIKPSSGSVKLFGTQVLTRNLKLVGYVPQKAVAQDTNFPFTVFETVMLGKVAQVGPLRGLGPEDRKKVEETLKLLGIYELKDRRIGQLSGGQSQRVFVAKAMVADPKLLLLDEPTSGIDAASKAEFYGILERLNKEMGITVILSSHDIGVITKLANRVVCINRSLFFCGQNSDFSPDSVLPRMYNYPVETMYHDHP